MALEGNVGGPFAGGVFGFSGPSMLRLTSTSFVPSLSPLSSPRMLRSNATFLSVTTVPLFSICRESQEWVTGPSMWCPKGVTLVSP